MYRNSPMKKPTSVDANKTAAPAGPAHPTLRQNFIMTNRNGLHARPCAVLIQTLRPFACVIKVEHEDVTANGNSILGLMALGAGFRSKLTFTISGSEAARAMAAVQRLFETQFQEAYALKKKIQVT